MTGGATGALWPAETEAATGAAVVLWGCSCSKNDEEAVVVPHPDAVVSLSSEESSLAARLRDLFADLLTLKGWIFLTRVRSDADERFPGRSVALDASSGRGVALLEIELRAGRRDSGLGFFGLGD